MKIEENDFILESINDFNNLFDLSLSTKINKGKENERSEMKIVAYGVPLETALDYIARYRTTNKVKRICKYSYKIKRRIN